MAWTAETRAKVGELGLGARLSDDQYAQFAQFLPPRKTTGRPAKTDLRSVLSGVLYVLRTGCQWRLLPAEFAPWQTVYGYFRAWTKADKWQKALTELRKQAGRAAGRDPEPSVATIDIRSVKTTQKVGSAVMMRASR